MTLVEKFGIDKREMDERISFLHISDKDRRLLKELLPFLERNVDEIVEDFYAHLLAFPKLSAMIKDEETLAGLKSTQREYLLDLCRSDIDESYMEKRLQIGIIHNQIGLKPKWYIGSYSNFMGLIAQMLLRKYRFRPAKLVNCIMAFTKVMNFDEQLAMDTYMRASMIDIISDGVAVLSTSSEEILASTTQLAAATAQTSSALNETSVTVDQVKEAAQLVSEKVRVFSADAQKAVDVSQAGELSVERTVETMDRIRELTTTIADSIAVLSEQNQAIGEIIASVNDLAEQSNLLAVNASIEAAKAGEHGRGFSVVAHEIRSLAEQSKQATTQVHSLLNDIQKAIGEVMKAMEQGSKAVDSGVEQSIEAGEAIKALARKLEEGAQIASLIAVSSNQQAAGMDQVAAAVQNIKEASGQNLESTEQVEKAARQLNELGQQLKELVEK